MARSLIRLKFAWGFRYAAEKYRRLLVFVLEVLVVAPNGRRDGVFI
jgi:hypothetical protein